MWRAFVGGAALASTYAHNTMRFAIPPQWDAANNDMTFEGTLANDVLTGTIVTSGGERHVVHGQARAGLATCGTAGVGRAGHVVQRP